MTGGQAGNNNSPDGGFSLETEVMDETREIHFSVDNLPPDQQFKIVFYATNRKGKSMEKYLEAFTLQLISGEKGRSKGETCKVFNLFFSSSKKYNW